jgi:hypothetical protein
VVIKATRISPATFAPTVWNVSRNLPAERRLELAQWMKTVGVPPPEREVQTLIDLYPEAAELAARAEQPNLRITSAAGTGLYGLAPFEPHCARIPLEDFGFLWRHLGNPVVSQIDIPGLQDVAGGVGVVIDAIPLVQTVVSGSATTFLEKVELGGRITGLLANVPGIGQVPVLGHVQPMLAVISLVIRTAAGVHEMVHNLSHEENPLEEVEKVVSIGVAGLDLAAKSVGALPNERCQAVARQGHEYLAAVQSQKDLGRLAAFLPQGNEARQYRVIE